MEALLLPTIARPPRAEFSEAGPLERLAARAATLRAFGASGDEVDELLAYNDNPFRFDGPAVLPDEPFVEAWSAYVSEASVTGVASVLERVFVQLRFPVRAGMSTEPAYAAATRRGEFGPGDASGAAGAFEAPERLRLFLHPTPAGRIPVIVAGARADFERLVRSITRRNEPEPVPASMGAFMASGYINWDRVRAYREAWAREAGPDGVWAEAFARLAPQKERYQDRFVVLSEGPYSAVPAGEFGLGAAEWAAISLRLRLEHECAHYYTKRALGSMRANALDEVVADAYALVAATGHFERTWFLRFMGIELDGRPREGGRLQNYRGPLSDGAYLVLARLTAAAAEAAEHLPHEAPLRTLEGRAALLRALAARALDETAG